MPPSGAHAGAYVLHEWFDEAGDPVDFSAAHYDQATEERTSVQHFLPGVYRVVARDLVGHQAEAVMTVPSGEATPFELPVPWR